MLEVHVEKGMQHGQKIVFEGEADEAVSLCTIYFSVDCLSCNFCHFILNFLGP